MRKVQRACDDLPAPGLPGEIAEAAAAESASRMIHVQVTTSESWHCVALYPGMMREDVVHCLQALMELEGSDGQVSVLRRAEDDAVVPISAALPDGLRLRLSARAAPPAAAAAPVAAAPPEDAVAPSAAAKVNWRKLRRATEPVLAQETQAGQPQALSVHTAVAEEDSDGQGTRLEKIFTRVMHSISEAQSHKEPSKEKLEYMHKMEEMTESMKRMSNAGTYLANDRTLLAWIRTGLALARTTFSMLGLKAEDWLWVKAGVVNTMAVVTTVMFIVGFDRFRRLRSSLDAHKVSPKLFGVGVHPIWQWLHPTGVFDVFVVILVAMVVACVAVMAQGFYK